MRTSDRPIEGGLPSGPRTRNAQQPHSRCLPGRAPEEDEVRADDQQPARGEQGADEPLRAEASDQRRDERNDPDHRHEEDDRQGRVRRKRDRARRDSAIDGALGSRGAAQDLLGPVVEPRGGSTDAADDLLGEPGRLPGDRVPELGARGDVAQNALRLVAREDPVGELERLRRRERGGHEALQFAARGELGGDPFEDAVADERARDLFRQ